MPTISSPACFIYEPDKGKPLDENLEAITAHIRQVMQGRNEFRLRLEIELPPALSMDAVELTALMDQAIKDAAEMEQGRFIPVAVDAKGKPLYQRQDDIG